MNLIEKHTGEKSIKPPVYFLDSYIEDKNSKKQMIKNSLKLLKVLNILMGYITKCLP